MVEHTKYEVPMFKNLSACFQEGKKQTDQAHFNVIIHATEPKQMRN
jgi:hypothetical protein